MPAESRRVLVFMNNPILGEAVVLTLMHGIFAGQVTTTPVEAIAILRTWVPQAAVLDLDWSGDRLLAELGTDPDHAETTIPVIGLTRRGDLKTKLLAFNRGFDDILTMPFSPDELLARVIACFRRAYGQPTTLHPVLHLGDLEINIVDRHVRVGNSVRYLTSIEQSLLYLLAASSGRVISREYLIDTLWGPDSLSESNAVNRLVRSLREKLQDDQRRPQLIATIAGQGYRFTPTCMSVSPAL